MSDITTTKVITDGQLGLNGHDLTQLITQASVDPSFITGKTQATGPVNTDQLVMVRVDNSFARILYSAFFNQDVVRKAAGAFDMVGTIINGDFSVWQRKRTNTPIGNTNYPCDRWRADWIMATGRITTTRLDLLGSLTGGAFNHNPKWGLRCTVGTSQASLLATEFWTISQRVERSMARKLFDNPSSFSIYLRCSVAGSYGVTIRNADTSQFYKQTVSIGTPNVWQRVIIQNVPAFPTGSGSWGTNEIDFCYEVSVCLGSGTNFQSATELAWTSGNMLSNSSQTNLFATAAATMDICLAQHEQGPVCTSFSPLSYNANIFECERYFAKSYPDGNVPGDSTTANEFAATSDGATAGHCTISFPRRMRATPTITFYNDTGTSGTLNGCTTCVAAAGGAGDTAINWLTLTGGPAAGSTIFGHWTADAEL